MQSSGLEYVSVDVDLMSGLTVAPWWTGGGLAELMYDGGE